MGIEPRVVEDLARFQHPANFEHDVCFVGWIASSLCEMVVNVVEAAPNLTSYIVRRDIHFDFIPDDQPKVRRKQRFEFIKALQKSRLSLCPANEPGVLRRRFWEALSMGRVPVVIDDQLDLSRWDSVCLVVPESRVLELPEILSDYIDEHKDLGLRYLGFLGREVWKDLR